MRSRWSSWICGAHECRLRPIVDFDRAPGVLREGGLEVRRHPECSVHDLRGKRGVGARDRSPAELSVQGRRCPRIVPRNPVKDASRNLSGGGYHAPSLLASHVQARRLEALRTA